MSLLRKSTSLIQELKNYCKENGIKYKRPIGDNCTRWNSTYYMLERAQYLLPAISYLTMKNKELREYSLDFSEKKYLGLIIEFLKTLEESTTAVEFKNEPTISTSTLILKGLRNVFIKNEKCEYSYISRLSKSMLEKSDELN